MKESNKPLRILIADDDPDDLGFLNFLFTHHYSFEVIGLATSGEQIIEEIVTKNNIPDILLIDMYMPTMTGIETIEKLKLSDAAISNIFVISTTINLLEQEKVKEDSRINFLAKPITLQEINELPDQMLRNMNINSPNII